MKKHVLSTMLLASALLLGSCGGSAAPSSPAVGESAQIVSGGSGLNVSAGPCIISGVISPGDIIADGKTVDIYVRADAAENPPYTIESSQGDFMSAAAGATVTIEGATLVLRAPARKHATQTFSIQSAWPI